MARDPGLEALLAEDLADVPGLVTRRLFGGLAWMLDGHLLCGARQDALLVRLGPGRDGWALACSGIQPMSKGGRSMPGWVRAGPSAFADDVLRRRLLDAAQDCVRALPTRHVPPGAAPWDFPDSPQAAPPAVRRSARA